jgi:hypothetical protein
MKVMNDDELLYYLQEERSRDISGMFNFIDLHLTFPRIDGHG